MVRTSDMVSEKTKTVLTNQNICESDSKENEIFAEENNRKSENERLLRLIKNGDKTASDELVRTNLGLVKNIALRFTGRGTVTKILFKSATVGMLKAISSI